MCDDGIKQGTCSEGHWLVCVSDESVNSVPQTHITLYVNSLEFKYFFKKTLYKTRLWRQNLKSGTEQ